MQLPAPSALPQGEMREAGKSAKAQQLLDQGYLIIENAIPP